MIILQPLPYTYGALEPFISGKIMELHHAKHQQAYVDGVNAILQKEPSFVINSLENTIINLNTVPESIRTAIRNHGGGVINHTFFWNCMTPDQQKRRRIGHPLFETIDTCFGSFDGFKEQFSTAARTVFGSGWAWLCLNHQGALIIITTPNQDSPLSVSLTPLLGLDVWEHAYYLQYFNKRVDYITSWWDIVNWAGVIERYEMALSR